MTPGKNSCMWLLISAVVLRFHICCDYLRNRAFWGVFEGKTTKCSCNNCLNRDPNHRRRKVTARSSHRQFGHLRFPPLEGAVQRNRGVFRGMKDCDSESVSVHRERERVWKGGFLGVNDGRFSKEWKGGRVVKCESLIVETDSLSKTEEQHISYRLPSAKRRVKRRTV